MNPITRFEIARRVLNHEVVVPLDFCESLDLSDFRKAVIEYGLQLQHSLETIEYNKDAGVSLPEVNFVGAPYVQHITCTGNTTLTVDIRGLHKSPLLRLHRRPVMDGAPPMEINTPRDAFLVMLSDEPTNVPGVSQYRKLWKQEEVCLVAARGFTFYEAAEAARLILDDPDNDEYFDIHFLREWAKSLA